MRDHAAADAAIVRAGAWIAANALILDTETTGLGDDAAVIELAVIDCAGGVLLDTLVRPSGPVPDEAAAIHGITDAMLADAPTWSEIHDRFCDLVEGRQVVIYSREFDARVIRQTARRYGLQAPRGFDLALDQGLMGHEQGRAGLNHRPSRLAFLKSHGATSVRSPHNPRRVCRATSSAGQ